MVEFAGRRVTLRQIAADYHALNVDGAAIS
jgi:hypothetical protein